MRHLDVLLLSHADDAAPERPDEPVRLRELPREVGRVGEEVLVDDRRRLLGGVGREDGPVWDGPPREQGDVRDGGVAQGGAVNREAGCVRAGSVRDATGQDWGRTDAGDTCEDELHG